MKKITLLMAFLFSALLSAQNNSADTTFINTSQIELDWYGDFDQSVEFPDGQDSYRQIIMTLKLGQYDCEPGEEFCHQWDYNTHIQLIDEDDQVYELGRFITPFATSGWPRFGSDWKQPYVFDVTDFYPLLKGNKELRIHYSGYSGGFTAEVEFAFIEGTPEREVLDIKTVYQLSRTYGDDEDAFNDYLGVFSDSTPEGTEDALLEVLVTGHGSDGTEQCCEFSSHYYDVLLDGNQIDRIDIWRDDCGENDLYPQGGTWIYDRSNWCPGAKVEPIHHYLDLTAETDFDLQVQFEEYTGSGELGSYNYNATIFYYGETHKEIDAALVDIISPTNDPNHFRANPAGDKPVVKVRNTGSSTITTMDFEYGVNGFGTEIFNWSGNIAPQEEAEITLTALAAFSEISLNEEEGELEFEVEIISVNGDEDEEETNNYLSSKFESAPFWPSELVLDLKTGTKVANGFIYNSGASDISWEISDMEGNTIENKDNLIVNTEYKDTVNLPETGFYKLKIKNENCFGLNWWPYASQPSYNSGDFKVTKLSGSNLQMNDYSYTGTDRHDWGCSYTQYFYTNIDVQSVEEQEKQKLMVYPNPAKEVINIDVSGNLTAPYQVSLVDIQGRKVYEKTIQTEQYQIAVDHLNNGLYLLVFEDNNQTKHIEKVVISN